MSIIIHMDHMIWYGPFQMNGPFDMKNTIFFGENFEKIFWRIPKIEYLVFRVFPKMKFLLVLHQYEFKTSVTNSKQKIAQVKTWRTWHFVFSTDNTMNDLPIDSNSNRIKSSVGDLSSYKSYCRKNSKNLYFPFTLWKYM